VKLRQAAAVVANFICMRNSMKIFRKKIGLALWGVFGLSLVACGGGGGSVSGSTVDSNTGPTVGPNTPTVDLELPIRVPVENADAEDVAKLVVQVTVGTDRGDQKSGVDEDYWPVNVTLTNNMNNEIIIQWYRLGTGTCRSYIAEGISTILVSDGVANTSEFENLSYMMTGGTFDDDNDGIPNIDDAPSCENVIGEVSVTGFGESILNTNRSSLVVSGVAHSAHQFSTIRWMNEATGESGITPAQKSWQTEVDLVRGRNIINFSMTDVAGNDRIVTATIDRNDSDSTGLLFSVSEELVFTKVANNIQFDLATSHNDVVAELYLTSSNGALLKRLGEFSDNGVQLDALAGTRSYTYSQESQHDNEIQRCYKAVVHTNDERSYLSDMKCISFINSQSE